MIGSNSFKQVLNSRASGTTTKSSSTTAQQIQVQQYDNGIKLFFYITKDGLVEPLNGATIKFKMKEITGKKVMNRVCEITDPVLGECVYVLKTEDLQIPGRYITEIETTYANGTILSLDNPLIIVVTPEQIERQDFGF